MLKQMAAALSARPDGDGESSTEIGTEAAEEAASRARIGMVIDMADASWVGGLLPVIETPRFPYSRPEFMYLVSEDELAVSGDQMTRPILVPKDPTKMPLYAGYAEAINGGKTVQNEDQAAAKVLHLAHLGQVGQQTPCPGRKGAVPNPEAECSFFSNPDEEETELGAPRRPSDDELLTQVTQSEKTDIQNNHEVSRAEGHFFGVFDGHAGTGAALMASNCLHEHIRERLSHVLETILHLDRQEQVMGCRGGQTLITSPNGKALTRDSLVVGALETAFVEMDDQISEEKLLWRIPGGCACIAAVFLLGKIYVANAGDCRALLVCKDRIQPLSQDFTPDNERKRLQYLAFRQPDLLGRQFSRLEYSRYLGRKDIRKKVLYRDWYMDGWALKTVRESDVRAPLISDGPRKVRLLNTIGVTRGFGDHHLMTVDDRIPIKPFLSPVPEVQIFDMTSLDSISDLDVLILASDGLWDVVSNEEAANIVQSSLSQADEEDVTRYTLAAQDLVTAARGDPTGTGRWELANGTHASTDDITVMVIPLKHAIAPPNQEDDDDELLQIA